MNSLVNTEEEGKAIMLLFIYLFRFFGMCFFF